MFFASLILIANAAEENTGESYNATNEIPDLSYSNDPAANNSYGLNNTENNLSNVNEAKISNNTSHLNDTPENNNTNLSDTLTVENKNTGIEENQNNTNEIASTSDALTLDVSSSAAESEEEGATSVTASFGVYLEIVG